MAYELVGTPKTELVTQALAIKFRDMDPVPNDRRFSSKRLEVYRKMLVAGLFRPVQWATAFCGETQGNYRVNGKHTSTLLAEYEQSPQSVYAMTEHYHCDTLDDLARLYATFDSRTQVRTTGDINRAFAAVDPDLADLPNRVINLCVSAIAYVRDGEKYAQRPAAERAECLLDDANKAFIAWLDEMVGSHSDLSNHMRRGPVASAMYATFIKSKKAANEFWLAVRDGTGASPRAPDRVLHRYLLTKSVKRNVGNRASTTQIAGSREMFVKCLHAWNAWRRDSTTDLKYHAQAKIPAAV
jgi:hypothetical protein